MNRGISKCVYPLTALFLLFSKYNNINMVASIIVCYQSRAFHMSAGCEIQFVFCTLSVGICVYMSDKRKRSDMCRFHRCCFVWWRLRLGSSKHTHTHTYSRATLLSYCMNMLNNSMWKEAYHTILKKKNDKCVQAKDILLHSLIKFSVQDYIRTIHVMWYDLLLMNIDKHVLV